MIQFINIKKLYLLFYFHVLDCQMDAVFANQIKYVVYNAHQFLGQNVPKIYFYKKNLIN
jgi:hypothetical protein